MTGHTGNRAYREVERKHRKRTHQRANKGLPSLARRRRAQDMIMAMKLKGLL